MKRSLFIVPLLILFLAGCASTAKAPASGPGSADEPIKVEAAAFLKEFDANKISAQDKYKDKYIQTAGFIGNISGGDALGLYAVINPAPSEVQSGITVPYFGSAIQCYLEKSDASALTNGQSITIKGQVQDQIMTNVQVKNCSVVK